MKEECNMEGAALRYAGVATLLRRPLVNDPSGIDIALIGVPYDGATENRPGARHGPREIRNMSSFTRSIHHVTRVNPYEQCNVADLGDVNFTNPFDLQQCFADITDFYRKICVAGAVPLSVGGDHSISLPILRAIAAERPVGVVHLDAHTDTNDTEFGHKLTHGTPFRRAMEEGLLDPKRTIQIGIRGAQNSEESWQASEDAGIRVMFMEEFTALGIEATLDEIRRVVGQGPTYISFDIDCLDPAFAPGTGTPEIGGLTPIQAQALIRGLAGLNLIGGDVVEVSPPFDPTGNTALVGATILYEIVCVLADAVAREKSSPKNA
ncbi:MAG TPA: agmatinase [Desulfobacteraceae bacterium]|nr:agmatinase [Desulfobacteraceae bacterium]